MRDDILWIRQTLEGDELAFRHLVNKYQPAIYSLILSWVNNSGDAEELAQDVFLKAYQKLNLLKEPECFYAWIHQIARHQYQDWRRKKRHSFLSLQSDTAVETPSADELLLLRETLANVMKAIDGLPEIEKRLLKERYLEDASYEELQSEHGLTYRAIAMRLFRAKQKVREQVSKFLSGFLVFPWKNIGKKLLIGGGIEAVKMSVKTKLVVSGVAVLLILSGTGIVMWNYNKALDDSPKTEVNQAIQKTSAKPPDLKKHITESGQRDSESLSKQDKVSESNVIMNPLAVASSNDEVQKNKEEKSIQELKKKTQEYSDLANILPSIIKVSIRTVQLINEQSKHNTSVTVKEGEEPPVDDEWLKLVNEIEDGVREEKKYYKQIGSMFPDLNLYAEWYDPTEGVLDQMNYRFDGNRLLEYFGKDLPWDGNTGYSQAKEWDGKTNWRDLMDSYKKQIQ